MVKKWKRWIVTLVALALLLTCLPAASAAGSAMNMEDARTLLNSVTLYPQKTGYPEVDALMGEILAPYAASDTYTKVKAAYDWTVRNVNFSWAPYSQNWAPAYDCYATFHELEYDTTLQEVVPYDTVNRAYHAMAYHEGVCYDYASLFALFARYIGIDSYVHTGPFVFEAGFGTGSGHHGWTELVLNGKNYIFDPQRDYRMSVNGTAAIPYYYFGISYENAWRYTQETAANAARDAQFVSVMAEREHYAQIKVEATASGTATGGGTYLVGDSVTVTAQGDADFFGWFTEDATLCTQERTYTFTANESQKLIAVFSGEFFMDIPNGVWYYKDAAEAGERWIVSGIAPFTFGANSYLTRAMAVTMIARAAEADLTEQGTSFADVPEDAWFAAGVAWAEKLALVDGIGDDRFAPHHVVTREQYIVMLIRYAESCGAEPDTAELEYTDADQISAYALEAMQKAQSLDLLAGYEDGSIRPLSKLSRAEGVALLMRLLRCLETA